MKYRYLENLIINKREDDALSFIHEHGHDENINPDILSYQIRALPKSLNKDLINKSEILLEKIRNFSINETKNLQEYTLPLLTFLNRSKVRTVLCRWQSSN